MNPPHAGRSTQRVSFYRYVVTSLLPFFHLQKRQRPSRSDGGCCEKGVPSSGEKIVGSKN